MYVYASAVSSPPRFLLCICAKSGSNGELSRKVDPAHFPDLIILREWKILTNFLHFKFYSLWRPRRREDRRVRLQAPPQTHPQTARLQGRQRRGRHQKGERARFPGFTGPRFSPSRHFEPQFFPGRNAQKNASDAWWVMIGDKLSHSSIPLHFGIVIHFHFAIWVSNFPFRVFWSRKKVELSRVPLAFVVAHVMILFLCMQERLEKGKQQPLWSYFHLSMLLTVTAKAYFYDLRPLLFCSLVCLMIFPAENWHMAR